MEKGILLLSLDFELFWGVQDGHTYDDYGSNVLGGRKAIPKLLELFDNHDVHCSWATVGMMFAESKEELYKYSPKPENRPHYDNSILSSYRVLDKIGNNEKEDKYFYGKSLIDKISEHRYQEIASHTFSHYYARETGQNINEFQSDLMAASKIARDKGYEIKTLVFPRNQSKQEYENAVLNNGFVAYRGEERDWIHKIKITIIKRMFRLLDSYINLTGSECYKKSDFKKGELHNFRGSRFLRPYNYKLRFFENLKIRRIKGQMKHAAKNGEIFHLWWHPHNIGINTEKNLNNIEEILNYYDFLKSKYGMESKNMCELANEINEEN